MADTGVGTIDTSSYGQSAPTSLLDSAKGYGDLATQKLGLDTGKFKLAHAQQSVLLGQIGSLLNDPNSTPEQAIDQVQRNMRIGIVPPTIGANMIEQLSKTTGNPDGYRQLLKTALITGQDAHGQLGAALGLPTTVNDGQQSIVGRQNANGFVPQTSITQQTTPAQNAAPTTYKDANGVEQQTNTSGFNSRIGNPLVKPPQVNQLTNNGLPSTAPQPPANPLLKPPVAKVAPGVKVAPAVAPDAIAGPSATFDADKTAYTNDLAKVPEIRQSVVPLREALGIARQLAANPTLGYRTPAYNNLVASATNMGIIKADPGSPAALTAELNKYLAQGVTAAGGNRSDMDLAAKQAATPNSAQVDPALIALTKKTIGQKLMSTYAPQTFDATGTNGVNGYQKHAAEFGTKQNLDAYTMADSTPEERASIMQKYMKNGVKDTSNPEAMKFFDSVKTLIKHGDLSVPAKP